MMFLSVLNVFYCSFITMRSIYQLYIIHNILVSVAHNTGRHCDDRVGQGPMVLYRCYNKADDMADSELSCTYCG